MPTLEELLSEKPELLSQVKEVIGDKKLHVTNDGNWIPKEKFNDLNEEKKQLVAQLGERDQQLETLKKSSGDTEKLQQELSRMQEENKTTKAKYESEMRELRTTSAIRTALAGKVHNPDVAMKLLDASKIELDDSGAVKGGFDDQVKSLKESDPYLFVAEPTTTPGRFNPRGATPGSSNHEPAPGSSQGFGKQAAQSKKVETPVENPYFK